MPPEPKTRGRVSKKRERRPDQEHEGPTRQRRRLSNHHQQSAEAVKHDLLAQYYPKILTLRQYLLDHLPTSSKLRRRKIEALGTNVSAADEAERDNEDSVRVQLAKLLDTTLVGLHACPEEVVKARLKSRLQQWIEYSQKDDSRVAISNGEASAIHCQSEIVDFIIWLSFSRAKPPSDRPNHLLCDGYRKTTRPGQHGALSSIQGVYNLYFNTRVAAVKQTPWPQLLLLLGKSGESMMINMLLDCAVFLPVKAGQGNYYQLSGTPMFECEPLVSHSTSASRIKISEPLERTPAEIVFVRNRMLYARAALSARGLIHFGLRHIHALNRFPLRQSSEISKCAGNDKIIKAPSDVDNTVRTMMYMFPRQFGLHNVFTSHVDTSKTAQKLQDYTLREEEIFSKFQKRTDGDGKPELDVRVPKRLRGKPEHLVQRLQAFHARCSYTQLLQHYCPVCLTSPSHTFQSRCDPENCDAPGKLTKPQAGHIAPESSSQCYSGSARAAVTSTSRLPGKNSRGRKKTRHTRPGALASCLANDCSSLTELAVPVTHVSAFCQAVLLKIIPHDFWGQADVQRHNRKTFLQNVDRFVKLRRFETISLHDVTQGIKITEIDWLAPPGLQKQKCSRTDFRKRSEIFHEFVYYVFDSILIPLIRSNFYVTESNLHRYRLFFFRHDTWRSISEPAMAELKTKMFEEVKLDEALSILDSRRLGYSHVRLLPKQNTVRPIMNLRRRMVTRKKNNDVLGQSINSILGPVYNMFKLEKNLDAGRLGSAMFSVGDIYNRIRNFKQRVGSHKGPFFFAKVDVQGAFDSIPQAAVIALMESVPSQAYYEVIKYIAIQPNDNSNAINSTVMKRWHSFAKAQGDLSTLLEMVERHAAPGKKNTVYVDSVFRKSHKTRDLLAIMKSHIQQNLVKIGKKYYRQKNGIPQGSVISSMLCNYFYAELERTKLQFLQVEDSLLLRLVDDFLLITTDKSKAARFVTVMQRGVPEYGVTVSPSKTLVNFIMPSEIDGATVPPTTTTTTTYSHNNPKEALLYLSFPYCGLQIDTRTLEITKDRSCATTNVRRDPTLANALTVEYTRRPGANFTRKVLNAFKLQAHLMFFDTRHNTPRIVHQNLRNALTETAAKAWAYTRCIRSSSSSTTTTTTTSSFIGRGKTGTKQTTSGSWAPPSLWTRTINELIELAYRLLTSRMRRARYPGYECRVSRAQVRWLALGAFREVLGRKQASFGEVLAWLDREMGRLEAEDQRRDDGSATAVVGFPRKVDARA